MQDTVNITNNKNAKKTEVVKKKKRKRGKYIFAFIKEGNSFKKG